MISIKCSISFKHQKTTSIAWELRRRRSSLLSINTYIVNNYKQIIRNVNIYCAKKYKKNTIA